MIDYKIVWIDPKDILNSLMNLKEWRSMGYKIISNFNVDNKGLIVLELVM